MRLSDKFPVIAGRKKNPDIDSGENDSREDAGESSVKTGERVYISTGENYSKPDMILILRLAVSVVILILCAVLTLTETVRIAVLIAAALISGADIVIKAAKDVMQKMFLRENLYVAIAAAVLISIGWETEAVLALLLLQTAYIIRDYALYRTWKSICDVLEPDNEENTETTDNKEYSAGEEVKINAGAYIPVDCIVESGSCSCDFEFYTGESSPVVTTNGDYIPAGSICTEGRATAKACVASGRSLNNKLADLLKSGFEQKTEVERRFEHKAGLIVLFSLIVSLALLAVYLLALKMSLTETLQRIATIIAIASPCGIMLTLPAVYFSGMASARRKGVIFSSASATEKSALIKSIVFNKVGTLTEKSYTVTEIKTDKMDPETFLKVAAYAESNSESAVAKAIVSAYGCDISNEFVKDFTEKQGSGISVTVDDIKILLGTGDFIQENGVLIPDGVNEGNAVHMSVNSIYAGRIVLSESVSADASEVVRRLCEAGTEHVAMVSGDTREKDRAVSSELGINEYYAECSPAEKIIRIEDMKDRIDSHSTLAFVGAYDCPKQLFDAADIGISINAMMYHSSQQITDVMILANSIKQVPTAITEGKRINRLVFWGIFSCCMTKLIIVVLAAFGLAPIWFGILLDVCVSLAVLVNCTGAKPFFLKRSF